MNASSLTLALCCALPLVAVADDWPQYRGPNRDDVSAEKGLLKDWPKEGPKLLWTYRNAGIGYSGPAIVGDRLYTMGARDGKEYLIALDTSSFVDGNVREAWATEIGPLFDFKGNNWSAGPSATPTVDGDLIFALGGNGDLVCVGKADGKVVWKKNLPADLAAEVNPIGGGPKKLGWGFTWSPLVDGDQLVCLPGGPQGTVAALNKKTGEVLWRSKEVTQQAAYASPMLAEVNGQRQYVVLTNQGVFGVSAQDGSLLWMWETKYGTEVVNSPIVRGSLVYVTVGGAHGCTLLRIKPSDGKFAAEEVYTNRNLANHHGNVVLVGEHIYGAGGRGWLCQSLESGEIAWTERAKLRAGSVTYADGQLFTYAEGDGTLAVVEANPTAPNIVATFRIPEQSKLRKPSGKIWTPPVVANSKLFLRDQELIFCYDVAGK
ncbi:PQQ-binding-like beta-propeller repeat protein [Anatilimnocola sp. NA78]|uniref:PQQ-binding-like beta-propeller repeat protein n=1 Tax=Anatilimnocola sp. NA78 TaxID=3415683 RepID=UPI003CE5595F